ncbi:hypothetical protein, partial [Jatrophihabitans sp.]|uniref:hypothetical protein n=1 Tax=Jatrophihabitans sp. TaxID=1932789 RepID=UPI0030C6A617|nr:glyoxalase/bleomycin resistance protein/dioxygenase superfamily protein [Jatrophihabitans sp.]
SRGVTITESPIIQTAWVVEELDATEEFFRSHFGVRRWVRLSDAGLGIAQRGEMADGAMRFAYLDGGSVGVPYLELAHLEPMMTQFFESVREQTT